MIAKKGVIRALIPDQQENCGALSLEQPVGPLWMRGNDKEAGLSLHGEMTSQVPFSLMDGKQVA